MHLFNNVFFFILVQAILEGAIRIVFESNITLCMYINMRVLIILH